MDKRSRSNRSVVLTIAVGPAKTVDDVIAIARTEGRKCFGCDVDVLDIVKRSDTIFWVEVRPRMKYPGLDVEASKMARSGL